MPYFSPEVVQQVKQIDLLTIEGNSGNTVKL